MHQTGLHKRVRGEHQKTWEERPAHNTLALLECKEDDMQQETGLLSESRKNWETGQDRASGWTSPPSTSNSSFGESARGSGPWSKCGRSRPPRKCPSGQPQGAADSAVGHSKSSAVWRGEFWSWFPNTHFSSYIFSYTFSGLCPLLEIAKCTLWSSKVTLDVRREAYLVQ